MGTEMPWRQRYITTRRHPLAVAAYLVTFLLGLFFELHVNESDALFSSLSPIWLWLWKWEMLVGGGVGLLFSTIAPRKSPHWPDLADCLRFESIAAFVSGFGLITYSVAIVRLVGWSNSTTSYLLLGSLALGMLVRGIQALRDSTRVIQLAALADAVTVQEAAYHKK